MVGPVGYVGWATAPSLWLGIVCAGNCGQGGDDVDAYSSNEVDFMGGCIMACSRPP